MHQRRLHSWTCLLALVLFLASTAGASDLETDLFRRLSAAQVPLEKISEPLRARVDEIISSPTLYVRGPTEAFPCRPAIYRWLLDEPDWNIAGWKALAGTPISIDPQADGSFLGKDNQGGSLRWQCVFREPGRRIWYAEGSGRMAPFLPVMTLKAVLCLRYQEVMGDDGRIGIRHRTEAFAQYDAKSAGWFTKMLGLTPEATGKKVLEQVEIFHSGMAYYVSEHPEWAKQVLAGKATSAEDRRKFESLRQELVLAGRTRRPSEKKSELEKVGLTAEKPHGISPRP